MSRFDADTLAVNSICADPTVHQSAIVPDLKTWTADRFDEVQVFIPSHLTQHDVSDRESRVIDWHNRAELPGLDLSLHGRSTWAEADRFSGVKPRNVMSCPAQNRAPMCILTSATAQPFARGRITAISDLWRPFAPRVGFALGRHDSAHDEMSRNGDKPISLVKVAPCAQ